ncbi:hypothetical protein LJC43_08235, partial [Parabacteroides sp. OttesenSCG-928-G21]|nr:hypothetical protein [Parabacteroides sp. OttesenSCG-928-G21]
MKRIVFILSVLLYIPLLVMAEINPTVVQSTIDALVSKNSTDHIAIKKGVRQVARLWQSTDGDEDIFKEFCLSNYIAEAGEKRDVFFKISDYLEAISGHFSQMSQKLDWHVTIETGPIHQIDYMFSTLTPQAHFVEDMYANKIAFFIALNFPKLTLQEKESLGNDRLAWAYARLGDRFTSRIPTSVRQQNSLVSNDADRYIDAYNIFMGELFNAKGKQVFPKDMILLSHWNLRDEIKANYNKGAEGLDKQKTIYEVMKRIISQEIPKEVVNSDAFQWNPFTNTLFKENNIIDFESESPVRYQKMLNNFHAQLRVDKYMD